MENKKIYEADILSHLNVGAPLLTSLIIKGREDNGLDNGAATLLEIGLPNETETFRFVVEAKAQNTPRVVSNAVAQVKAFATPELLPMIVVPYLSTERLADLERQNISGIDLCGNGLINVPGRLYMLRTGEPNRYRDSRPLNNPYRGRSALVARMFLKTPRWPSLGALRDAIEEAGEDLSLSQASKAVQALQDDMILSKNGRTITLREPLRLLDKLGRAWTKLSILRSQPLRLPPGADYARLLTGDPKLKWATTGDSSVTKYAVFSQGGPQRLAVSNLPLAQKLLGGTPESVPNFADVELIETDEPGSFFDTISDDAGLIWASRLQTWLELQAGDARQQDAARGLRREIENQLGVHE